uniref:Uncharacterized protein n=1 Tax=Oryza glumipatula TaxID=40148 RepID=A0A0D9YF43_9ORYZ
MRRGWGHVFAAAGGRARGRQAEAAADGWTRATVASDTGRSSPPGVRVTGGCDRRPGMRVTGGGGRDSTTGGAWRSPMVWRDGDGRRRQAMRGGVAPRTGVGG